MKAWKEYCQSKGIAIKRPDGVLALRTHYYDGKYTYNAKEVNFIQ